MEVREHIVLFLDILGYSNLISQCKSAEEENQYLQKIHTIVTDLAKYIETWNAKIDEKHGTHLSRFKALLFSDNILFFAPYDNDIDMHNLYTNLLYGLSSFISQYVKEDIFFRGGITAGRLFYDENAHFVFGSGLVQAYYLESAVAKYPRIVIDKKLAPSPLLVGFESDTEGTWYLDYLNLGYCLICDNDTNGTKRAHFTSSLHEQQTAITNALKKYRDNEKVYPKYQWLAQYHNDFCIQRGFEDALICKKLYSNE